MPELTRETLPPAGPDYPLWSGPDAPDTAPVQRERDAAPTAGPRVLPREPGDRVPGEGDDS
jgi:hypothetical protein